MKNLILFVLFILVSSVLFAQTRPTEVTPDSRITKPVYEYIWGTTADTLTNADTLTHVIRVKGDWVQDFNIRLYSDFVSGTAGGTLKAYQSPDGVNYEVFDTITVSSLTADALDVEVINMDNYLYPYLKLIYLQTGTAVTIPRAYIYSKKN
jgi:hypothetical protein